MKKIILLNTLLSLFLTAFISNKEVKNKNGIQFYQGTWSEVLEEAKKENKLIFVDCYAVWCGPCKAMAKKVFTKDQVGVYFNENFINYKLNMETPQGKEFAKRFGKDVPIKGYPTMFFIDSEEEIQHRIEGKHNAQQLLKQGKKVVK